MKLFLSLNLVFLLSFLLPSCGEGGEGNGEGSSCSEMYECDEGLFCSNGTCYSINRTWRVHIKSAVVKPDGIYWDSENDPADLGAYVTVDGEIVFDVPVIEDENFAEWDDNYGTFVVSGSTEEIRFVLFERNDEIDVGILSASFTRSGKYYSWSFDKLFNEREFFLSNDDVVKFEFNVEPL